LLFVGGQIGWNAQQQFESDDFIAQTKRQALQNILAPCCKAGGAGPSTWSA
jgi:enamine deaminase RidA (YjgF/YER057c/UK114 family)